MTRKQKNNNRRTWRPKSKLQTIKSQFVTPTQDNKIVRMRLTRSGVISSNGLGVIASVLTTDPSNSSEWASAAALYDEFRIIGTCVKLVSKQQYSVTAATDMIVVAYDDDDVTALTSVNQGLEYSNSHVFNAVFTHNAPTGDNQDCALKYTYLRPTSGDPIHWEDVSNPTTLKGAVKFYGANLTNSINYMVYSQEYFVEFRGRS